MLNWEFSHKSATPKQIAYSKPVPQNGFAFLVWGSQILVRYFDESRWYFTLPVQPFTPFYASVSRKFIPSISKP